MKPTLTLLTALALMLRAELVSAQRIEPNWKSMVDNYQCPDWFRDGKIGIWLHWGPQSILEGEDRPFDESYPTTMYGIEDSQGSKNGYVRRVERVASWHVKHFGPPSEFGYDKLIPLFKADKWDPDGLVQLFKDCGARFIVPISTHVDNFDMYDSSNPWNSVRMGPHRDVVGEWKKAAVKHGLKLGVSDERQGENLKPYSEADIRFTTKDGNLYAFVLAPPTKDIMIKALARGGTLQREIESMTLLGSKETVNWSRSTEGLTIKRPELLPCKYAVGFRIMLK